MLGKYLKQAEVKEFKLRTHTESKLVNVAFFSWIDSFNRRVHYRQQYFKASQHWSLMRKCLFFRKLQAYTLKQRALKFKYRNLFLMQSIV